MYFAKMYFITYCKSPTCFGRIRDHHQGFSMNTTKVDNKLLIGIGENT